MITRYLLLSVLLLGVGACKMASVPPATVPLTPESDIFQTEFEAGKVLLAFGESPKWVLQIDREGNAAFLLGDQVRPTMFRASSLQQDEAGNHIYTTGRMRLEIKQEKCQEGRQGLILPLTASLTVKSEQYSGCAQFIYDADISGRWRLTKVDTTDAAVFFRGPVPTLSLAPDRLTARGKAGCNTFQASAWFKGSECRFDRFVTTKVACEDLKAERTFIESMERAATYRIAADTLTLFTQDGSPILVFLSTDNS